jgi:cytochrome b subunit of formate dehydrogenase/mono/diheme cytochrome c family protein
MPLSDSTPPVSEPQRYKRFDRYQRIEHAVFLIAFTILAITGLAQKFATSAGGEFILGAVGGIETSRIIHRSAAIIMMAGAIYHVLSLLYRVMVRRVSLSMLPLPDDFKHLLQDIQFYLGRRMEKARYGRFSYVEKAEYFAIVWGTVVMAVTGFMMWNPIATARFLPGEAIPAAKAAHGGEALLAVLAINLWHFYHVHIRHLNLSMLTGWLSREEMEHEHPAELEQIEAGKLASIAPPAIIRRRETAYYPIAGVLALVMGFGLYLFVTFEQTAIKTVPPGEVAPAFFPQTATVAPTFPPTATVSGVREESWNGHFSGLFRDRCGTCHGVTAVGGLSLATYADAVQGGDTGPGIVPGNSLTSMVVTVQQEGGHPGQLSPEEIEQVIDWIEAGAPEN